MNSHIEGLEEIKNRLAMLEKQNRWLKRLGTAALILTASLLVMGQASPKKTVEANEFILKDTSGIVRARLAMAWDAEGNTPKLALFDTSGKQERVALKARAFPGLVLRDAQGHARGSFFETDYGHVGPVLVLQDEQGHRKTQLGEAEVSITEAGAEVSVTGERVRVTDAEGFAATIGTTGLVTQSTGETHKTSAAAIVLFDKNKNVLWKAPQ